MILPLLCERKNTGRQHIVHRRGFLLLGENHQEVEQKAHHDSRSNTAGLNGDNLVDFGRSIPTDKLYGYGFHQIRIHLMVDKLVNFQDATLVALAVL